jgi:branched-chain amino acid transport system substrate-binding protein
MKKILIITIIIISCAFIFGLSSTGLFSLQNDNIKIGLAIAQTDVASSYGEEELRGTTIALEEFNSKDNIQNKKITLVIEDTQTDQAGSIKAVQKLISVDNVDAIIGTTWLETFIGAAHLAKENKILMITPSGSITSIKDQGENKYVYSTWYRADKEIDLLLKHIKTNEGNKIAVILENNAYWEDMRLHLKNYAKENNIIILEHYKINGGNIDLRTEIQKIKTLKPDTIIYGFDDSKTLLSFGRQIKEIYPEAKLYSTESVWSLARDPENKSLFDKSKFIVPKIYNKDFIGTYVDKYNEEPTLSAINAYDATMILLESLKESKEKNKDILEILNTREFNTKTFGKVHFDSIGGIIGGEFEIVEIN